LEHADVPTPTYEHSGLRTHTRVFNPRPGVWGSRGTGSRRR
jgi:hypothetical protein